MKTSSEILNENDPYLREIWAMGYDKVMEDVCMNEILLLRNADKFIKRVKMYDIAHYNFKIITMRLYSGEIHKFISEADGSCEKFRNIIKPN